MEEQEIHNMCRKFNIRNYTINPDGSIDVDGNVNICDYELTNIPIRFHKVRGWFDCSNNNLTTLENSPTIMNGKFFCTSNKLTNLIGCPKNIHMSSYFFNNPLESLEGYNNYEDLNYNYLSCDNKEELVSKHKKSCRNIRMKHLLESI